MYVQETGRMPRLLNNSLLVRYSRQTTKRPLGTSPPGAQAIPFEEISGRDREGTGELDHRVDAGQPLAALQLADLGSMHRGTEAKLFLGEVGAAAVDHEVLAEALGDFLGGIHQSITSDSR